MSWVESEPVKRRQRPAVSVTNRPVPSVSRSVETTTCEADVKKTVAPVKSSLPKKGETYNKPALSNQQVHECDTYFTIETNKGKSKYSSSVTSVEIFPIKFKTSILNKERLKIS